MLHKTFEYKEDFNGVVGWIEVGAPTCYNSGNGRVVAHDVLEHFKPTLFSKDSWEDELLALGACIYVRGENGYFESNKYYPDYRKALANDIVNVFEFITTTRKLRSIRANAVHGIGEDVDDIITYALQVFDTEEYGKVDTSQIKVVKKFLIKGYNLAKRRYKKSKYHIGELFVDIEEGVNDITKFANLGDLLKVNVSVKTNIVYLNHVPYWAIK